MPYKDPLSKREWELQHRSQRLARRRELRRIEADQKAAQPSADGNSASFLWLPFIAGTALASYNPKPAMGAGGLTLLIAAIYKKGLRWWIVGGIVLTMGVFFQWNDQKSKQ
jgi:hypothetical protein